MASFQKYQTKQNGTMWLFKAIKGYNENGQATTTTRRGFKTKKEAIIAAKEFEESVRLGTYVEEKNIFFKDFALEWLKLHEKEVKPPTIRSQTGMVNRLNKHIGNRKLKDITRRELENTIGKFIDEDKYTYPHVRNILGVLKMIFRKAVELEILQRDIAKDIKMPKRQKTLKDLETEKIEFLEKEELHVFLQELKKYGQGTDVPFFTLLAYSGFRAGEAVALQWDDVDFNKNVISITKTLYSPNNSSKNFKLLPPKSLNSVRKITIDSEVMELIKKLQFEQKKQKLAYGEQYNDMNFVFAKPNGLPPVLGFIQYRLERLEKYLIKNNLLNRHIYLHMFRHTHTSLLIEAGVGIKEIQQRLGHADIQTTMNIYAHMTENMEEKASKAFSSFMKKLGQN
ncbi:tyrosine-type recombinase/integrase [Heyndrickxia oleronia]|uniref:tyrosine-type recombinase/integrase n=1 Tax=Heyndrickxia oleronia TaxID=38875 RepID=UPI0033396210